MDLVFTIATCGLHVCPATAEVQAASCGFYAGAGSAVPATAAATVYVCVRESAYVCVCVGEFAAGCACLWPRANSTNIFAAN